ncbi:hypothetical protein DL764_007247 [Monosporascus ibericus]|uniref:Uncharacterized protein n=1 Tax=Monosporascus ibericus TaxID=155417 RepID=A0A4Q4T4M3_9PEZI|nr:hypothetical protein DL764_007247 [Monosporascus ibericus]
MVRIMIPVALAIPVFSIILERLVGVGVINTQLSPVVPSQTCTTSVLIGEDNLINEYSCWNPNIDFDSSGHVPVTLTCDRPVENLGLITHQTAAALGSSLSSQSQPGIETGVCHSHICTNTHTPVLIESALSTVLDEFLIVETPLANAAPPTQAAEEFSESGNQIRYDQNIPWLSEQAQPTGPHDMTTAPDNGSVLDRSSSILKRLEPSSGAVDFASALAETPSAEYTIPSIFNPECPAERTFPAHPIMTTPAMESLALPRIRPKIIRVLSLVVAAASVVFKPGRRLKRFRRRRNARLYPSPSPSAPPSPSGGSTPVTPPPGMPEFNFDPAKEARMAPGYKAGGPWCTVMIYGLDKKWGKMIPRRYGVKQFTAPPLSDMPLVEEGGQEGEDRDDFE